MRWKRPGVGSPRLALFFHGYWNATLAYDIPMAGEGIAKKEMARRTGRALATVKKR